MLVNGSVVKSVTQTVSWTVNSVSWTVIQSFSQSVSESVSLTSRKQFSGVHQNYTNNIPEHRGTFFARVKSVIKDE